MFLSTLLPLLRGASKVTLTLSAHEGQVRFVVVPTLDKTNPDAADPALAGLQALLNRPFVFLVAPDGDADAAAAEALRTMSVVRGPALDAFAELRATMEAATEAARVATAAKAKKLPAKSPARPVADEAAADEEAEGDDGEAAPAPAKAAAKPTAKPAPDAAALGADLFA